MRTLVREALWMSRCDLWVRERRIRPIICGSLTFFVMRRRAVCSVQRCRNRPRDDSLGSGLPMHAVKNLGTRPPRKHDYYTGLLIGLFECIIP